MTLIENENASTNSSVVFVVDDDPVVCNSIERVLESTDLQVECFQSAQAFLDRYDPNTPGCLILDLRIPGMDGLELQEQLNRDAISLPIIFVTAFGEVTSAVQAMKSGAIDFFAKPFNSALLRSRIEDAVQRDADQRQHYSDWHVIEQRLLTLTPREREVCDLITDGLTTKQIAAQLEISPRTVDLHRTTFKQKLQAESFSDLMRIMHDFQLGIGFQRRV